MYFSEEHWPAGRRTQRNTAVMPLNRKTELFPYKKIPNLNNTYMTKLVELRRYRKLASISYAAKAMKATGKAPQIKGQKKAKKIVV